MKHLLWATILVALAASAGTEQAEIAAPVPVDPNRLQAHIEFLASDSLRGRDTGTRGYRIAAQYVAAEFDKLGLQPAGDDGSFYQRVPLSERQLVKGSAVARLETTAGSVDLDFPTQFTMGPDWHEPDRAVTAKAVFVGYGIVAPDFDHDDYRGLDVEGKIAVILNGRPKHWPTEEGAHLASGTEKVRHAVENGAIGLVILHSPRAEETFPWEDSLPFLDVPGMGWIGRDGLPDNYFPEIRGAASFNLDAAALLFDGAPTPLEAIYAADVADQPISGFPLDATITLKRKSTYRTLESANVVAAIEGSDPVLKDEYLIYTAHLDHLGVIPGEEGEDAIYNGAMDNAAGVATLLETARVLIAERDRLQRSVMFLVVTGEEKGLLGAGYFAKNPTVPIDSIVANINLDMPLFIYPFADVVAFGAEHSTLKAYVDRAAARAGIKLSPDPIPEQGLFTRSDHYKLVQQGVPAVFLVTGFESRDPAIDAAEVFQNHIKTHYHKPSDDTDLPIDYASGALFTEININIGREVCNSPERPRWNAGDFFGRTFARSGELADPAVGEQVGEE
jgi:hypothetical protein